MRLTGAVVAVFLLAGCSGGEAEEDAEPAGLVEGGPGDTEGGTVAVGGTHEYPDGLVVSVGDPVVVSDVEGYESREGVVVEVTASNPTEGVVTTTSAWVGLRYGDAGTEAEPVYYGDYEGLDAVLQPGAEAVGGYAFLVPPDEVAHVTLTVHWPDSESRETVQFQVAD